MIPLSFYKVNWRYFVITLTPIILSLLFIIGDSKEIRCAYVILVMSVSWMTEAVPLAVTALVPVFAFPLLGILSTSDVCLAYMKETNMMFLGGLTVAVAVEYSQLHKRISLMVILFVGQSPRRLMAGFMLTTMFLSMWISNTATTAMMVPIVEAVLEEIQSQEDPEPETRGNIGDSINDLSRNRSQNDLVKQDHMDAASVLGNNPDGSPYKRKIPPNQQALRDMYFLATAYASNIGGTGSLTGTGPNIVVKSFLEDNYTEPTGLNFGSWMLFNVPGMIICVAVGWIWLQILFIHIKKARFDASKEREEIIKKVLRKKYSDMGSISHHEITVLVCFIILVLLWLFRTPEIFPGIKDLFQYVHGNKLIVKDATPAILIAFLLFILPKSYSRDQFYAKEPIARCLTWEVVQTRIPWGVIILLGGGFAMADATKASGLSLMLGKKLTVLSVLHPAVIVLLLSLITAMATEVSSNTATAFILIPILNELAQGMGTNPLYLMLPAALSCSYAFMLPVATPPNAIVFEAAKMNTGTMITAGVVMNILCLLIMNIMINTLGVAMFDVMNPPSWINSSISLQ